ncbi:MAG TPA: IS66 family transposase [Burkholderiales bacterium]|nr:IS66 family transposase [Burkholderiales bacterium]
MTSRTSCLQPLSLEEAAGLAPEQVAAMSAQLAAAQQQIEWFKRQLFGQKSERRVIDPHSAQLPLMQSPDQPDVEVEVQAPQRSVGAHTRSAPRAKSEAAEQGLPFFDASRVPIELIELAPAEIATLSEGDYEIIGHKDSYRLAQRPGSYVVLHYRRAVVKLHESAQILTARAPVGVFEGSRADVSFVAGLLIDKMAYHLPLYRQHQRLADAGISVSRAWLTQLTQQAASLLEPIYCAQFDSIRASRVKAMDETPIKAARAGPGKMKAAYFWPIYGELDEVCFPFFESRRHEHVEQALGFTKPQGAVLLSDGYAAYARYAAKSGITHAQCWAHCRRGFFEAQGVEPQAAAHALELIGALYEVEAQIKADKLSAARKLDYRLMHAKPIVERFFAWVEAQLNAQGLLPSNPLTQALAYARERRFGLEVFLTDPEVPIDSNHLERALRAIPMGRRNWLFSWTELGAQHIGIVQSLIVTCRLHQINPYDYLVDVLQRVAQHPAARVAELTPRLWKQHFAEHPLRSPLHKLSD